jgi:hypothetical protein
VRHEVFDQAFDVIGDFNLTSSSFELSLDEIRHSEPDEHDVRTWTLDGHNFSIQLQAQGFTQYLRQAPILTDRQRLTDSQRGGLSFDQRGYL